MIDAPVRVELRHSCAICGKRAAMPADGGMQLSVINAQRRVMGFAVHPACLQEVLTPAVRANFEQHFAD